MLHLIAVVAALLFLAVPVALVSAIAGFAIAYFWSPAFGLIVGVAPLVAMVLAMVPWAIGCAVGSVEQRHGTCAPRVRGTLLQEMARRRAGLED